MIRLSSSQQEFLKWLAISSMVIDHMGYFFLAGDTYVVARSIGRLAFPLFCFLIAYNLTQRGIPPQRYYRLLLLFALISQFPYILAFDTFRGNILFTLLLGVTLQDSLSSLRQRRARLLSLLTAIFTVVASLYVSYSLPGILLIPAFALWLGSKARFYVLLLPLSVLLLWVNDFYPRSPWGLMSLLAIVLAPALNIALQRSPKWFFYWFYPVHLTVLTLLAYLFRP